MIQTMKSTLFLTAILSFLFWLSPPPYLGGQSIVREYKIKNLISGGILQKFQQINQEIEIYDHLEGNRLILVGDSLQIESAMEQLKMLDSR